MLNKAEIIKENAVQQCKDEVNIQVRLDIVILTDVSLIRILHKYTVYIKNKKPW